MRALSSQPKGKVNKTFLFCSFGLEIFYILPSCLSGKVFALFTVATYKTVLSAGRSQWISKIRQDNKGGMEAFNLIYYANDLASVCT